MSLLRMLAIIKADAQHRRRLHWCKQFVDNSSLTGVVVIAENAALNESDGTVLMLDAELRLVLTVEISNYFHLD